MSASVNKTESLKPPVGAVHAAQPVSGTARVDTTTSVNGLGHGGFVRVEKTKPAA